MTTSYMKLAAVGGAVFIITASLTNAIITGHFFGHRSPEPKIWHHIKIVIIVGLVFLLQYFPASERDNIKPVEWGILLFSAALIRCIFDIFPR
jgi:hypothetical protein